MKHMILVLACIGCFGNNFAFAGTKAKKPKLRAYQVVESKDISIKALSKPLSTYSTKELNSAPMNIRKVYRIVVPSDITPEEIKLVMKNVLNISVGKDPDIDEVCIFAYDRKEDADGAFTFAKMEWCPNGKWDGVTPRIARSNDRSSYKSIFTIKDKVGNISKGNVPTKRELKIYDVFDKALWDDPDADEKVIEKKIAKQFSISTKELTRIWIKVETYKQK